MNTSQRKFSCPRILVIGGGLMGLWPAVLLAREGCAVTVLEASCIARGASWAAAGMLAPASEVGENAAAPGVLDTFGAFSLGLWSDWAAQCANAGHEVCWRPFGALITAFDEAGLQQLQRTRNAALALDLQPEMLSQREALRLEPALSSQTLGALNVAAEASVDPRRVMVALRAILHDLGVAIRHEHQVTEIALQGGAWRAVSANGQVCDADAVIIAAGFGAGAIKGAGELAARLRPVKGQMLALQMPDNPVKAVIRNRHAYIVPRGHGRIVIGATSEPGQTDTDTHTDAIARLRAGAAKVMPALAKARCVERWAGVRPRSVDGLPLIGPCGQSGIFANGGHHRNGVLLAPASARMMCAMIMGKDAGPFAEAFLPERFAPC